MSSKANTLVFANPPFFGTPCIIISCLANFQDSPGFLESSKILLDPFLNSSRLIQTLQNILEPKDIIKKYTFPSFRVKSKGRLFQVVSLPGYLPSELRPF